MKVKKALPLCLFLSLLMPIQSAHAFGWLRFLGIGSRAASTTVRVSSSAARLSSAARSTSLMKGLGKEALIMGGVGVVANELYESYQSNSEPLSIQNYVAEQNNQSTTPKEDAFSYTITNDYGDPDLMW